ncbi:hypothetical protein [Natrinema sp. SYSU A 869]|uniref:hypothetical protein n=1 Tax=Natrinema sp. SYSU A 869 TaxID=2871694 RepID=UPI001CA41358|nr:hypothetical protein [Natrinema sp. SYSU A 869]
MSAAGCLGSDDESGNGNGNGTGKGFSNVEYSELEGLEGGVASLSLDAEQDGATGEFAAVLGDADTSALEDSVGSSADESSVDVDDDRLTASASWDAVK